MIVGAPRRRSSLGWHAQCCASGRHNLWDQDNYHTLTSDICLQLSRNYRGDKPTSRMWPPGNRRQSDLAPASETLQHPRMWKVVSRLKCLNICHNTWNIGDILHMSMSPDPRYWPQDMKKVRRGIPKNNDNNRNWTTNTAEIDHLRAMKGWLLVLPPKSMVRMTILLMLNMPSITPRQLKRKLCPWGHTPIWLFLASCSWLTTSPPLRDLEVARLLLRLGDLLDALLPPCLLVPPEGRLLAELLDLLLLFLALLPAALRRLKKKYNCCKLTFNDFHKGLLWYKV